MCLTSRFKPLSHFLVPLEYQRKEPPRVIGLTSIASLHHDALCTVLFSWGLETLSKKDFVVSVLGGTMFLQAGLVGSFLLRLDGNSRAEIVMRKKRLREVQSLLCKLCLRLLPV